MNKPEAVMIFRRVVMPGIWSAEAERGHEDGPMRCEAWNNFTDMLCKEGLITPHQYQTWDHPTPGQLQQGHDLDRSTKQ